MEISKNTFLADISAKAFYLPSCFYGKVRKFFFIWILHATLLHFIYMNTLHTYFRSEKGLNAYILFYKKKIFADRGQPIIHYDSFIFLVSEPLPPLPNFAKNMIMFEFGITKSQRQINAANPNVRKKHTTFSTFLTCKIQKSVLPSAHSISIFSSSRLNNLF